MHLRRNDAVGEERDDGQRQHVQHDHDAPLVAGFEVGVSRPVEEGCHVAGLLLQRRHGAVRVFEVGHIRGPRVGHGDHGHNLVVVGALGLLVGIVVAGQQRVDVVGPADARTRHGGQVWRCLAVRGRGALGVAQRPGEGVVQHAGAGVVFAVVVDVRNFVVRRDGLGHVLTGLTFQQLPAKVGEGGEAHQTQRVTGLTAGLVDVETALQLALVVVAQRAGEGPALRVDRSGFFGLGWRSGDGHEGGGGAEGFDQCSETHERCFLK